MSNDWFSKACFARAQLRSSAAELRDYAHNCETVGLRIAAELYRIAGNIAVAESDLEGAISQGIDEECQAARAAVLNIGPACLEALKTKEDKNDSSGVTSSTSGLTR